MRVLLADDHGLFLEGIQNLLTAHGWQVIGTARDGLQALEQARALHPELILMDVQMPKCDGLTATRLIKAEMPEIKIVMLTMSDDDEHLFDAIKSGATGYLLKSADAREFFELLDGLPRGEAPLSRSLSAKILQELAHPSATVDKSITPPTESIPKLTERQMEVLTLVAQGLTNKQIGEKLFLTERAIKYHMGEILARLHLENRAQVIAFAARTGLLKSD